MNNERSVIGLILMLLLSMLFGIWLWDYLHSGPYRVNVHIESVGSPVEAGIAKRREALRAMAGVDIHPLPKE